MFKGFFIIPILLKACSQQRWMREIKGENRMRSLKLPAIILMLWPYLGIALLYLPGDTARTVLFLMYIPLTLAVYGMNIACACCWKGEAERLAFWDLLIKLAHIPFHLTLFLVGLLFLLAMVVPALIFVSPIVAMVFAVICWLLMLTTSSYGLNAVVRGKQEGTLSGRAAVVLGILHLFFVADVIGAVILLIRLRKKLS